MERELSTEIKIGEENYRIRKMTALDGGIMLKIMSAKLLPLLGAAQKLFDNIGTTPNRKTGKSASRKNGNPTKADETSSDQELDQVMSLIPQMLDSISADEMKQLMTQCLNYADKMLAAGWCPIMRGEFFAIPEAEYDTSLCMTLLIYVLIYNSQGFFGGSGSILSQLTAANFSRQAQ